MKTGQTFDLVEIIGNTSGYEGGLQIGQQCISSPFLDRDTSQYAHHVKFDYGNHTPPLLFLLEDLKKIGKLTITKIK